MTGDIMAAVAPHLLDVALTLAGFGLLWLSRAAARYVGEDAAEKARLALDAAMRRAVMAAVARHVSPDDAAADAARYVAETMPEAVRKVGASDAALQRRARAEVAAIKRA